MHTVYSDWFDAIGKRTFEATLEARDLISPWVCFTSYKLQLQYASNQTVGAACVFGTYCDELNSWHIEYLYL